MMRALLCSVLLLSALPAAAQPRATACVPCTQGDALIDRFSLQPLRSYAAELAALPLVEPLSPPHFAKVVELRTRNLALQRIGAIDDADLPDVAAALCGSDNVACTAPTLLALRCLADRCEVALPPPPSDVIDVVTQSKDCNRYLTHRRSPPIGVGFDWGNGIQSSKHPTDGRAWSFGIEARTRLTRRFGAVARVDRIAGRDEGIDTDGNGIDDSSTGSITRISALVGASMFLDYTKFENTTRFLRLDVLAGYLATRSQPDEAGPALGFDLGYQLSVVRIGARVIAGLGEASEASVVLLHIGIVAGSAPQYSYGNNCDPHIEPRRSRLAIGLSFPIGGYGFPVELGYTPTGIGVAAIWHLHRRIDVLTRADLIMFTADDRDRAIHQAVLGGFRFDHKTRRRRTNFQTMLLVGATHGSVNQPTRASSGFITDLSFGWGTQSSEAAAFLRLHGRFGLGPDNFDYRAIFLSADFELRLDPQRWRDRR